MKKTKMINKIISTLLAFTLIFCTLSTNVSAFDIVKEDIGQMTYPDLYDSAGLGLDTDVLDEFVDIVEFKKYLFEQFATFAEKIDILKFKIPYTMDNMQALIGFIWYYIPEAFQVYGLGANIENDCISKICVTYYDWCSADEFPRMYAEFQSAASTLLDGVENNDLLTDVEKALLLHDRLAVWNEYDYENYAAGNVPDESYSPYGALVKRTSVCQGYMKAYAYLLNCVGIKNTCCSSKELNHIWNIVYIDNIPYHVDVTADDPVWDVTGRVCHNCFLVSTDYLKNELHNTVDDYDTSPQDSRYDNYYWRNSTTEFQLIDNALYFIDNSNSTLNKIYNGTATELISVDYDQSIGLMFSANLSKLSSDGSNLLLSLSDAIYEYNFSNNTLEAIYSPDFTEYSPDLTASSYFSIYGFTYEDGYLICDLDDAFSEENGQLYQVRHLYNQPAPTVQITSTNNLASSQTLTFSFNSNAGIAGYYWGTNSSHSFNTYTATSSTSVTKTVDNAGTYYLVVKDISGNLSKPESITFYKTTLDGNGGSVSTTAVLTAKGNSFTFPIPVRNGYQYKGWSDSSSATNGITSLTPSSDTTYYAVWQKNPVTVSSIEVNTMPTKTVYTVGETFTSSGLTIKVNMSDGTSKTVTSGFTVSSPDMTTSGTKTVTVTYQGKTTTFTVTVNNPPATVSSIEVSTMPKKTVYTVGETFSLDGLIIKVNMSDGTSEILTNGFTVSSPDMTTAGTKTVIVTYQGKTTTFTITVNNTTPEVTLGNVNSDGKITIVDAKWILQNVADLKNLNDTQKAAADLNKDGKITIVDAKWVLQIVSGLRDGATLKLK